MKEEPKLIKFKNHQDSNAQFDLIKLEDLYRRTNLDHFIDANHKIEFYILIFIEKGQGYHTIDFTDYICSKGTLLTIRKDQIHKFFRDSNLQGTLLLFTDEFLVNFLEELETEKTMLLFNELLGIPKLQLEKSNLDTIHQSIKRIENEYLYVKDSYSLNIIRSELHILITKLFRVKSKEEKINVNKEYLKEFIQLQTLAEKKVSQTTKVMDFADQMNLSTKTLNTITRTILHKSAKDFIDEISIKQIKRLLLNTKLSIKEIAYKSGFEETTNFYKYFKRQTNATPEQFRSKS